MANAKGIKRERSSDGFTDYDTQSDRTNCTSPSQKRGKFERSFVPSWLDRFEWLSYENQRNLMFCNVCRKYRKNNAFTEGCQNFRRDNLNKHVATNDHKFCTEQEQSEKSTTPPVSASASSETEGKTLPSSVIVDAASPATPSHHSSSDSCRSSGIFSSTSGSLPQSPASLPLPSPPAFALSRTPNAMIHAPVPILPFFPNFHPYLDPRFSHPGEPSEMKQKDPSPITANYLAHPPFPYLPGSSSYSRTPEINTQSGPKTDVRQPSPANTAVTNGSSFEEEELVLKVRVANSLEQDFIEMEIERKRLSFDYVLSTICRELSVNPSVVHKLRKLPNTIIRKDKDVKRFVDFQELELVLTTHANNESRHYSQSVSPRHVDVVY